MLPDKTKNEQPSISEFAVSNSASTTKQPGSDQLLPVESICLKREVNKFVSQSA